MRVYRACWSVVAGMVTVAGMVMAASSAPPFIVITLFVTFAVCGGVLSGNLHLLAELPPPPRGVLIRRVGAHAVLAGAAAVACYGFGRATGSGALMAIGCLAVSSPYLLIRVVQWAIVQGADRSPVEIRHRAARTGASVVSEADLVNWTDAELYWVWCLSLTEVHPGTDPGERVVAARAREHLLTEFDRRHPSESAQWLESGAILDGQPPTFLVSSPEDR